ncbi:MAG: FecR domain-containing protein [Deltaproteobacteria bacterium]|nr:FecR domain-containing protein [Deltaproteobacteria bacterium]
MKRTGRLPWALLILLLTIISITSAQARSDYGDEGETILVGRISYVKGKVLRYIAEEEDWVAIVKDTPFGMSDALHSEKYGRAEIIMPNNTWARIDDETEIRLIALRDDVTEIEVTSGVARFYNKSSDSVVKAVTPFGHVMAPGDTTFDLCVSNGSAEVVALKGTVYFVHKVSETRFEVIAGSSSLIADNREVTAGEAYTDPYWHAWNSKRDALWVGRMRVKGKSVNYLPSSLYHDAYVLDEHGRWERVYYNGTYYDFWRPLYVGAGWVPFTVGRWIVWYGDHTWIPCEPFGYVTHHYGAWVFIRGYWYWAPPVPFVRVSIGPPLFPIPFFWFPGRVAWIHRLGRVGWVPLAPWEPYYCYRRWGPRTVIIRNVNITNVHLNINRYKHFKHAVVIDKKNLYRVKNYRKIRIRSVNHAAILNKYRMVPVINKKVVRNYGNIRHRYSLTKINEMRKPPRPTVTRIGKNKLVPVRGPNVRAKTVPENVGVPKRGKVTKGPRIKLIKVKNRAVPPDRIKGPVSKGKLEGRRLKGKSRSRGADRRQLRREVEKPLRKVPPKPVMRQTVRRKDHGHTRGEAKKQWTKIPPKSVRRQPVRGEKKRLSRSQPRATR